MERSAVTEVIDPSEEADLVSRVLGGEVIVVRGGLQRAGLLEPLRRLSLDAVYRMLGEDRGRAVEAAGFEHIHDLVDAGDIPSLTDAIYADVAARAPEDLSKLIPSTFKGVEDYYFESSPNIRFHIPFDQTRGQTAAFDNFAKRHGEGKLSAHGPHRDPWLDCPDNGINIWIAMGHVQPGNGLTIYQNEYRAKQRFADSGNIVEGEHLTRPTTFDLQPGDFILFHTDHLHGSELNRTRETRFVISYRVTFDRPHFPNGHYHSYRSSRWADGPLRALSVLPAMAQFSYLRSLGERAAKRLLRKSNPSPAGSNASECAVIRGDALAVGEIRPLDAATCVARLGEGEYAAFSRRCPHKGADLADGFVDGGRIVCPWHNLPFDPATGRSPCETLRPLAMFPVSVDDGVVQAGPRSHSPAAVREGVGE